MQRTAKIWVTNKRTVKTPLPEKRHFPMLYTVRAKPKAIHNNRLTFRKSPALWLAASLTIRINLGRWFEKKLSAISILEEEERSTPSVCSSTRNLLAEYQTWHPAPQAGVDSSRGAPPHRSHGTLIAVAPQTPTGFDKKRFPARDE